MVPMSPTERTFPSAARVLVCDDEASLREMLAVLLRRAGYTVELAGAVGYKETKSYSTGADTLEELAAAGHELPQYLLRFRELAKLKAAKADDKPKDDKPKG